MKSARPLKPAIEVLEKELSARETLDPAFFSDAKQQSLEHAISLGIDAEAMKKLLGL